MKRFTNLSFQGRCLAGQLSEAAKKAAEKALDKTLNNASALEVAEPKSRRADSLLAALLALLLLAGLTKGAPAHATADAHGHRAAQASPTAVRGWHEVDALADLSD